jgi:Tfp pilus assembly protein PilF
MGRLEDCSQWLDRALKLEPNSRAVRFEFARLLLEKGDPLKAATRLTTPRQWVVPTGGAYLFAPSVSLIKALAR